MLKIVFNGGIRIRRDILLDGVGRRRGILMEKNKSLAFSRRVLALRSDKLLEKA